MDVIKKYESKSDTFLLPLTGLQKDGRYKIQSFLFWEDYSIENYNLILKMKHSGLDDFLVYCKRHIFPVLNKNAYLSEAFDIPEGTIYILDLSDWKRDIDHFLNGKYSKLSTLAKDLIKRYHVYYEDDDRTKSYPLRHVTIDAALYPNEKMEDLGGKTPIEKMIKDLGLKLEEAKRIREIGEASGIYERDKEILLDKVAENKE